MKPTRIIAAGPFGENIIFVNGNVYIHSLLISVILVQAEGRFEPIDDYPPQHNIDYIDQPDDVPPDRTGHTTGVPNK